MLTTKKPPVAYSADAIFAELPNEKYLKIIISVS